MRDAGPGPTREREAEAAHRLCARWGCGTGRPTEDALFKTVAEAFGSMMGCEAPTGCPFEGVFRSRDGWVQALQAARVLVKDDGMPWEDALERPLTAVDRDAILVLKRAENRLDRMKRDQDEQEQARRRAEQAPHRSIRTRGRRG